MFNSPLVISWLVTEDIYHKQHETKHNSCDTVSKELYKIHSKDAGMSCGWTDSHRNTDDIVQTSEC